MSTKFKRTRIKVCGMSDVEEVAAAIDLGVDAIGIILHASSPRSIDLEQAHKIRHKVPAFVDLVGVFVDAPADMLKHYYTAIGLDLLQLHGAESGEFANSLNLPYIKAIRAKSGEQVASDLAHYKEARAILLDPFVEGQHGGTGKTLNSKYWPSARDSNIPLILAGGLGPDNLARKIEQLSPYAVDLNSGVEVSPGRKSIERMTEAVAIVRAQDA